MAEMNTLQMVKTIPKFDGGNFVECTRSFNDIIHICWPFLSRIVSERPEAIPRENGEGKEHTSSDLDGNDSGPCEVSVHGSGNLDEEPHNRDDIRAWDSGN